MMALDKEKILSELGNVVSQLQNADCGCMEKTFPNSNTTNNSGHTSAPCCGYRQCCHGCANQGWNYGQNVPCAREPHTGVQPWMDNCNPRKLYADTYNYMNKNLMQPAVKGVYDELKSLCPANTVSDNPLARPLGLPPGNPAFSDTHRNTGSTNTTLYNQMSLSTSGNTQAVGMNSHGENLMTQNPTGLSEPRDLKSSDMSASVQNTKLVTSNMPSLDTRADMDDKVADGGHIYSENPQENTIEDKKIYNITVAQGGNVVSDTPNHQKPILPQIKQNVVYQSLPLPQLAVSSYQINQQQSLHTNGVPSEPYQVQQRLIDNGVVPQSYRSSQPVYTTLTGASTINQPQDQLQLHKGQYYQQQINPNVPVIYGDSGDLKAQVAEQDYVTQSQAINALRLPVETSQHGYTRINKSRDIVELNNHQNLSLQQVPQQHETMRYSNVKSTISKTSLMGNKPIGNIPSRNQLQHLYDQYKKSQSFTPQNVKPTEKTSHSAVEPKVVNKISSLPLEKVVGDTIHDNQINKRITSNGEYYNEKTDVFANDKPPENNNADSTAYRKKCRNGLQDMVFTSYPSSTAWTFHGNHKPAFSTGYRFRNLTRVV